MFHESTVIGTTNVVGLHSYQDAVITYRDAYNNDARLILLKKGEKNIQ